ncbi:AbrB/MazE/SpoVT family DNA-binding domain-containing protein [Variovorax sp. RA8]|jgi:antitoxin MazE|uniref:AbrB/MazE/SpoVT family DNA-binding domain-containing protein n=1 Tax=Variovorax sp. (strain JCM 16519 / RA8) TaxID=662548 RepID=UPI000B21B65E|nr:AbrB/MazE/SpoVT family DNA-binding domain-containing protein [Variovorax sp. RA8]VTU41910.1 Growth regulator [Variovorax sp. RA8]
MQVAKWGNSLAIRLPLALVKKLNLSEGDEVRLSVHSPRDLGLTKKPGKEEIVAALREFEGRLPEAFKFDRDDANER